MVYAVCAYTTPLGAIIIVLLEDVASTLIAFGDASKLRTTIVGSIHVWASRKGSPWIPQEDHMRKCPVVYCSRNGVGIMEK